MRIRCHEVIAMSQTKTCGCNEPLPCAPISPRKPTMRAEKPGALEEAATPSVHQSRGGVDLERLRFCMHSGRTPKTWMKKRAA